MARETCTNTMHSPRALLAFFEFVYTYHSWSGSTADCRNLFRTPDFTIEPNLAPLAAAKKKFRTIDLHKA